MFIEALREPITPPKFVRYDLLVLPANTTKQLQKLSARTRPPPGTLIRTPHEPAPIPIDRSSGLELEYLLRRLPLTNGLRLLLEPAFPTVLLVLDRALVPLVVADLPSML